MYLDIKCHAERCTLDYIQITWLCTQTVVDTGNDDACIGDTKIRNMTYLSYKRDAHSSDLTTITALSRQTGWH